MNIIMWSGIEACASTICANLPCYGPLLGRARSIESIIASLRSFFSVGSTRPSTGAPSKKKSAHGPSASTENMVWLEAGVENYIEGGGPRTASGELGPDVELGTIKVHNAVDINSSYQ